MNFSIFPRALAVSLPAACLLGAVTLSGCKGADPTRYNAPPTSITEAVTFVDTIQGGGVGGTVTITRAADDNDASAYVIRWGNGDVPVELPAGQSNYIGSIPLTHTAEQQLSFNFSVLSMPENANSVLVLTSNANGEATSGLSIPVENMIRHPLAPTAQARSLYFSDRGSNVAIFGELSLSTNYYEASNVSFYNVRYAGADGCILPGEPVFTFRRSTGATHYRFNINRLPPKNATSLVVVTGNVYGEAYLDDCSGYVRSTPEPFNYIYPDTIPYHASRAAYFTGPDTDSTYRLSRTLVIEPSEDERDLSTGYYVNWRNPSGYSSSCGDRIAYFPKNGGSHTLVLNRAIPRGVTEILVGTGRECVGLTTEQPAHRVALENSPNPANGTWFQIKNASNGRCISADDRGAGEASSGLSMATCDAYAVSQRFTVANLNITGNDDLHHVRSVKTGGCFKREYWSGNWQLDYTCATDDLFAQMELTKLNTSDRAAKRMVVRNNVAGVWHYSCAWADLVQPRPTGTWGNCGWGIDMTWHFMPFGNPDPLTYALFNDN